MQFRNSEILFSFLFLLQVIDCYQKNDYARDDRRYKSRNYFSGGPVVGSVNNLNYGGRSPSSDLKLRHSSKFPKFDELKTRIDNLGGDASGTVAKPSYGDNYLFSDGRSRSTLPRFRHHGWSNRLRTTTTTTTTPSPDEDLFRDEKMEDDDSFEFFYSTDDDDDDDDDDDEDVEDINADIQAEEPTIRPDTTPKSYSSMSDFKWDQYGNRKGVEEARRMHLNIKKSNEENRAMAAIEHYIRVKNTGSCRKPISKVIPVQQEHPNPAVTYTPHCTVLHRCAEDTGCCRHEGATCQYKEKVDIPLYFYVKELGSDQAKIEKLIFSNHTECECREKSSENVTERQKRIATLNSAPDNRAITMKSGVTLKSPDRFQHPPENIQFKCKCPKEFIPKMKYSNCFCGCNENNQDCLRMKKGKEYYSLTDRLCIINRKCGMIECEYGPYMKDRGRCPRRDE